MRLASFPRREERVGRTEREVEDGIPEGGEVPDLEPAPPLYAPSVSAEDIEEIAKRL